MTDPLHVGTPIDKVVEIAQKAGKWGVAGLFCFLLQGVMTFIRSEPTWHTPWDFVGSLGDMAGTFGIGLTLIGVLGGVKRGNDMTATIGAESKIDRAAIATALPNAPAIEVMPQSSDPAVQREIVKQLNGKQAQMANGIEAARIRTSEPNAKEK